MRWAAETELSLRSSPAAPTGNKLTDGDPGVQPNLIVSPKNNLFWEDKIAQLLKLKLMCSGEKCHQDDYISASKLELRQGEVGNKMEAAVQGTYVRLHSAESTPRRVPRALRTYSKHKHFIGGHYSHRS